MSVRPEFPNVLLLEDDPHFAAWAAAVLQRECIDLKVAIACDSPSAQRLLESQPQGWRIAVVDLNLGADCGSGFIDYLHREHPHLPSLVVTSVETPERALAALQAGDAEAARRAMQHHMDQSHERFNASWPKT